MCLFNYLSIDLVLLLLLYIYIHIQQYELTLSPNENLMDIPHLLVCVNDKLNINHCIWGCPIFGQTHKDAVKRKAMYLKHAE
jgi:hypothetical protein